MKRIIIVIVIEYLYSAQSTICPWRFTLKKNIYTHIHTYIHTYIFKKPKILQYYINKLEIIKKSKI